MDLTLSPLWISLKTATVATALATVGGVLAARWMYGYRGKLKRLIDGLLTLPLVLPPIVVGFLLLLLFGRNSPIGRALMALGIQFIFSWPALVVAATVVAFPLAYKTVLGAFLQVDRDAIACARTLGASQHRIFWQILLPLAWPGVMAGTVLAFARALGEFGATVMVAGSIPGRTVTIPIYIYLSAEAGRMDRALLWVAIAILVALGAIFMIDYGSGDRNLAGAQRLVRGGEWLEGKYLAFRARWVMRPRKFALDDRRRDRSRSKPPELAAQLHKQLSGFNLCVNLKVGEYPLGILGKSGSGKSLTLRCLAGLDTPDRGRIVLNGRILFDSERGIDIPSHQRRIGLVFQNYALFPHMSVVQNIGFGLQGLPRAERDRRIRQYVSCMQLKGLEHRYPRQLSGGQQQRVALARALAIEPDALLFDEPLSALDNYLRNQIEQLLIDTFSTYDGTVLFVTHKLEEAFRLCQYLLVLSDGHAIACDRKEEIFKRPASYEVAQITECKNFSRARRRDANYLDALDWNCRLRIVQPIPEELAYVGIRAHHLFFSEDPQLDNIYPCWLTRTSQMQHRITLYLKLHAPPHRQPRLPPTGGTIQRALVRTQGTSFSLVCMSQSRAVDGIEAIINP